MPKDKKSPILIIVSAPSGAGKTTLCKMLLKEFSEIELSISCTTRQPRSGEKHGVDYLFLKQPEFQQIVIDNGFAEWAQVHGNFYGTSKESIENAFSRGKSLLLEIDVQGAKSLKSAYPAQCLTIFISPPSLEELERRLRDRKTESAETLQERMNNAKKEMQESSFYDHVIVNSDLNRAYQELKQIVSTQLNHHG